MTLNEEIVKRLGEWSDQSILRRYYADHEGHMARIRLRRERALENGDLEAYHFWSQVETECSQAMRELQQSQEMLGHADEL